MNISCLTIFWIKYAIDEEVLAGEILRKKLILMGGVEKNLSKRFFFTDIAGSVSLALFCADFLMSTSTESVSNTMKAYA